jgi:hypothetical protein
MDTRRLKHFGVDSSGIEHSRDEISQRRDCRRSRLVRAIFLVVAGHVVKANFSVVFFQLYLLPSNNSYRT